MAQTWLVVGLGNPGPDYARTRHNIGQMALAEVERRAGATPKRHGRAEALVAESRIIGGPKVVTAFPTSWMNRSGGPVAKLMDWYGVEPDHVIVLHDELDLPLGTVRLKQGGGHGGHNGMRDIIAARGGDVLRVRLGIGRPPGRQDAADFVLRPFAKAEQDEADLLVQLGADAVERIIAEGFLEAQQRIHAP
ncbi:aminoacyl-tRNA hydrolase [Agrococcus sediminis]|uniref:Peptidyl-tRNA hydrolase n=1 Tax=Agrococcus sediminis TaxID=2599924 RepID=A0A5M8Q6I5_9MICO|nr:MULTISPECIES: aminoacyl-tRNA hydrolase [Agrococcus]KAA6430534.1 aminoacyl-tRNA hydrolase [Agrococcus sediminis]MDR7235008.1 PTH1 family peptidyl-tRNA hydrolase [Agrococcus sp. BE272]UOW01132.1 aminoacyl-tRNA hydrolase [Agrococcus sp. SCSIO52902]